MEDNDRVKCLHNKQNDTKLNVGSSCIQKFTIMENQGLNIKSIIKEAEKSRRTMIIDRNCPGVRDRLNKWYSKLDRLEIMIPNHIELQYMSLGKQGEQLLNQYLKGIDINIDDFDTIFEKADKAFGKILEYVDNNKNNPNVVTKKIEMFLKMQNSTFAINQLKKTGYINVSNAGYITEPDFMIKVVRKINEVESKPYKCSINLKRQTYLVRSNGFSEIELELSPQYFIECFSNYLFRDLIQVDFGKLVKHAKIVSELSIANFILESAKYLILIDCETDYFDIYTNTLTIRKIEEDLYVELDLSKYIEFTKSIVFKLEPFDLVPFRNFIFSRPRYTKKQLDDIHDTYRKSSRGR